jgi:hypothetical protein
MKKTFLEIGLVFLFSLILIASTTVTTCYVMKSKYFQSVASGYVDYPVDNGELTIECNRRANLFREGWGKNHWEPVTGVSWTFQRRGDEVTFTCEAITLDETHKMGINHYLDENGKQTKEYKWRQ